MESEPFDARKLSHLSEGDFHEQALGNIREAIRGWLEVAIVCEAAEGLGDAIPASDVLTETVEVSVFPPQVDDMRRRRPPPDGRGDAAKTT